MRWIPSSSSKWPQVRIVVGEALMRRKGGPVYILPTAKNTGLGLSVLTSQDAKDSQVSRGKWIP